MKALSTLILIVSISFTALAQDTGMIVGTVLDKSADNSPLAFANIQLKDKDLKTDTDFSGLFVLDYLEKGKHTLIISFPGYETQEITLSVLDEPKEIKISLSTHKNFTASLN